MKKATEVFGEWAKKGKDVGMEKTHAMPVNEMIDFVLEERVNLGKNFKSPSAIIIPVNSVKVAAPSSRDSPLTKDKGHINISCMHRYTTLTMYTHFFPTN